MQARPAIPRLSRLKLRTSSRHTRGLVDHDLVYLGRWSGLRDAYMQEARWASPSERPRLVRRARAYQRMLLASMAEVRRDRSIYQ